MGLHAADLVARLVELERQDATVAGFIEDISALADRVDAARGKAAELSHALAEFPAAVTTADQALETAVSVEREAAASLALAEERVAELEGARRRKEEAIDQARRELTRAREHHLDAEAGTRRREERRDELHANGRALLAAAAGVAAEAREIAAGIGAAPRVPDAGKEMPGETLEAIDAWGGRARAALFVARAGLESERERVVDEANALGASVLGEPLGASSVPLVRHRVEREGSVPAGD